MLKPPTLAQFVEPEYPREAFEQGIGAQVVVELMIAPDGSVSEANVVQGAGQGFDQAALAAARKLRFNPATSDGAPIPARIHFPFVFEVQEEEEQVAPETLPARLEGVVLSADSGEPIPGATIALSAVEGDVSGQTVSEENGDYYFQQVPPGTYEVVVDATGFTSLSTRETVAAGEALKATYRLEEESENVGFGAVARIPPPPREVTRRSIGRTQLTRIPGTRGDALRAVELMPGVARPPLGVGALIVRGSAPQDSMTLLEGLPVPLLYHFGGLTSFINSRLLERIDFYPGNFSVRYGRRRGGILEVKTRDPNKDRFGGVLDANLIDASFLVETPITDNWQVAAAARRSHIDVVLAEAIPSEVNVLAAPVYYDYQLMTTFQPSDDDHLRFLVFGSSDELALILRNPDDALTAGDIGFNTSFNKAQLVWQGKRSDNVEHDMQVSAGNINFTVGAGDLTFDLEGIEIYGRGELRTRISERVRLISGIDIFAIPGSLIYNGPALGQSSNNPENNAPPSNRDIVSESFDFSVFQPALYLESELDLRPVRVVVGTRLDYDNSTDAFAFDPRASAHFTVTDDFKLKGGIGMFSQPPSFLEANNRLGNPNLDQMRATHLSVGADYQLSESIFVGLDGFYKHLTDVVVGTEFGDAPFFTNDGTGRIYGGELSARVEPQGRFFGYLSYTLSRSERSIRGGPYEVFDFDQPHILTVSGTYRIGGGWEAGATFRLVSGNPNTPVLGSVFNSTTGQYSPIYGRVNSGRDAAFHRLDIRIEKLWEFPDWKLAAYLDLQNAYNSENPQGLIYSYDFTQVDTVPGIPIFPSLGLRGEI